MAQTMTKDEAADNLGRLANWRIPPDWMDPYVVDLARRSVIANYPPSAAGSTAALLELADIMAVLGGRNR